MKTQIKKADSILKSYCKKQNENFADVKQYLKEKVIEKHQKKTPEQFSKEYYNYILINYKN